MRAQTSPLERAGTAGWRLFEGLRDDVAKGLQGTSDRLQVHVMRGWISFKSENLKRVFAEVRPHRRDVEVFILPPPEFLERTNGLARSSPPTQGWGWFRSKFRLVRLEDVKSAKDLLMQSYQYRKEMSRRKRRGNRKD
ncbi:MAG: hypothetical protein ACE5HJ_01750 [Thermoplasmata archaeon]